jgi:hypothetical protein
MALSPGRRSTLHVVRGQIRNSGGRPKATWAAGVSLGSISGGQRTMTRVRAARRGWSRSHGVPCSIACQYRMSGRSARIRASRRRTASHGLSRAGTREAIATIGLARTGFKAASASSRALRATTGRARIEATSASNQAAIGTSGLDQCRIGRVGLALSWDRMHTGMTDKGLPRTGMASGRTEPAWRTYRAMTTR